MLDTMQQSGVSQLSFLVGMYSHVESRGLAGHYWRRTYMVPRVPRLVLPWVYVVLRCSHAWSIGGRLATISVQAFKLMTVSSKATDHSKSKQCHCCKSLTPHHLVRGHLKLAAHRNAATHLCLKDMAAKKFVLHMSKLCRWQHPHAFVAILT